MILLVVEHHEGKVSKSTYSMVAAARALVPLLRENAPETDRLGRLTDDVTKALREEGFLNLCAPRAFGGREASLRTLVEATTELARGCGASAWVSAITGGCAFLASLSLPRPLRQAASAMAMMASSSFSSFIFSTLSAGAVQRSQLMC